MQELYLIRHLTDEKKLIRLNIIKKGVVAKIGEFQLLPTRLELRVTLSLKENPSKRTGWIGTSHRFR